MPDRSMPSLNPLRRRTVGDSLSFLVRSIGGMGAARWWIDVLLIAGILGLAIGLLGVGKEVTGVMREKVEIDLSFWALPKYTFFSLTRGLVAYGCSLLFTLVYGFWAAKDKRAEKILVPLLDILQSIPVLGFMPGLVLGLVALFPHSNIGLELAAVLMIFTGQAWNMTFSYYHSIKNVPKDLNEVGDVYRFTWWQRLRRVELPFATMGLVWNSMMSMAGGWFFLMLSEAFQLGDNDYRLPGLGSYMKEAADQGNGLAQLYAVIAMMLMIIVLDQFFWRPVTVWAQKFRIEESGSTATMTSWFLDFLRRSELISYGAAILNRIYRTFEPKTSRRELVGAAAPTLPEHPGMGGGNTPVKPKAKSWFNHLLSTLLLVVLVGTLLYGAYILVVELLLKVNLGDWGNCLAAGGLTLSRVLISTLIGTLWAVPVGIMIGLSPRLSRVLQPVVQVVASFPAPMLFPAVIVVMHACGITLNYGAVLLMLLGTQWYVLFNVIAGAMAIPADLREASYSYSFSRLTRMRVLYIPAIFPYLVTGWVTAAGGAWNASIVSEYYTTNSHYVLQAYGLGAVVSTAAESKNFPLLAAAIVVMSSLVVLFNLTVWRKLYHLAETRYTIR